MNPTILHLEDSVLDAELIAQRLRRGEFMGETVRVSSRQEYVDRLCAADEAYDLILSDYQIPGFDGMEALELAKTYRPEVPFVFVSGALGEDIAVEMLKRGATDYVLKQRLDRLIPAVERALSEARERNERRRAEAALRDSEARLRMVLTAVRMVAWELNPETRKLSVIGNLVDVFGLRPGGGIEERAQRRDLLHPEDVDTHIATVEKTIKHGGSYLAQYRIVRPDDGAVQWMEERAHAICDESGKVARLVGVVVDVTDRKLVEDEVRRLNDQLEEKVVERTAELLAANEQLQGFTYSVAHDLRQQIRGISTNASTVLYEASEELDEGHRHHLERLVYSARQLSSLVDDLLRYARLGRQEVQKEPVDLSKLAREVAFGLAAEEYGGRAVVEVEPGLVASGDAAMLAIALQNLIDNAFKYSSRVERPSVHVGRDGDGFFVRDNGVGFDMAFAPKVFEPFERLHAELRYPGTGIGLANVKRIVEKHGGRIWVESRPNEGAKFSFTLG